MHIEVYNTYFAEDVDLPVNKFRNEDFNDFYDSEIDEYEYWDIPWTVSRSSEGNIRYLQLRCSGFNITTLDDINEMLEWLGIGGNLESDGCVEETIDPLLNRTYYYQKDNSTTYPRYMYKGRGDNMGYDVNISANSGVGYGVALPGGGFTYGKASAFITSGNNLGFYGLSTVVTGWGTYNYTEITFVRLSNVATTNYAELEDDPGDEGFIPIQNKNNDNRGGGSKSKLSAIYRSDVLDNPDEPDETAASIVGSGYVNVYKIDKANLANMGHCLFNDTLWTWFQGLTKGDPLDLIIALNVFPCSPDVSGSQSVRLGKFQCSVDSLGTQATGYPVAKQYKKISFGTINVGEIFESFLDYEATSMSLYLPFIGEVDIPICEVMGGSISLDYIIDFVTGACTANVRCTKSYTIKGTQIGAQYSQHSYQGNCAAQIPLTSASYGSMVGSIIGAAAQAAAGNVASASIGFLQDGATGQLAPTYRTKGNIQANSGFCAVLFPYITITRPITATPESFQEVMGYPSYMDKTLGSCQGLCICDNIDLHGVTGATESELNRIKQLCREGVYV